MSKIETHELKTWPDFFADMWDGVKTFEVRKMDRDYREGDYLYLREWSKDQGYSGRAITGARIEYILRGGQFGIEEGFCVLGLDMRNVKHEVEDA